ncbi:hypothetical protein [Roseiconus lacunae]|uniref:Uncharacterized protein n=1 Tax=Roseiconus lacunae TaxID=2605694 RepID=A0ABT7PCL5_9BACT|nr:hypothetical protein [Roseiconus lacunae]MCD0461653.1 hypothetical protein [Roseiconus lacunae]MDM4014244.1 hypothetical protein [Roseiconus lacunae]
MIAILLACTVKTILFKKKKTADRLSPTSTPPETLPSEVAPPNRNRRRKSAG